MDPENLLLLFSGRWPGNSLGIARLKFAITQAVKEEDPVDSSDSAQPVGSSDSAEPVDSSDSAEPDSEQPKSFVNAITVLYAANEGATVAVLDGTTGDCLGAGARHPEVSSKTLHMDLLGQKLPLKPCP